VTRQQALQINWNVPHRVKTVTASHAFRVAAPTIWNNPPDCVKVTGDFISQPLAASLAANCGALNQ